MPLMPLTKSQKIQQIVATAERELQIPLTQPTILKYLPPDCPIRVSYLSAVLHDWEEDEVNHLFNNYVVKPSQKIQKVAIFVVFLLCSYCLLTGLSRVIRFETLY